MHLLSDLHIELSPFVPKSLDVDVVILTGDIHVKTRGVERAKQYFTVPVLYVPGNHEFYDGHLSNTLQKLREAQDEQLRILDADEAVITGVRFLGATMWTNFSATDDPKAAHAAAQNRMYDFRKIRTENYRRIRPADLALRPSKTRDWLSSKLAEPFDGQTVVITHLC